MDRLSKLEDRFSRLETTVARELGECTAQLRTVVMDVATMRRKLFEGNGHSLVSRITRTEDAIADIREDAGQDFQASRDRRRRRTQIMVAVISSSSAIGGGLLTAFVLHLLSAGGSP